MVYGVFGGCYSDWYIVGYFDNRDDAEKYCCISHSDYYVEPLKNLTNEKDLSKVELKYTHEVLFDHDNKNNKYIMRKEPDRYRYYINIDCIQIKNNKNILRNVLDVYDSSIIVCFQIRLIIIMKQNRN